jgi:hypothetical protein
LGRVNIFRDIEDIPPGVEFNAYINDAVGSCDVLIALIGPRWLTVTDRNGRRLLDDPKDFTRVEILTALKRNVRVIPALVGGADIPDIDELPDDLKPLARRQAYELSDTRWVDDCRKLADVLRPILKPRGSLRTKVAAVVLIALLAGTAYGVKLWYDYRESAAREKAERERFAQEEAAKKAAEAVALEKAKEEVRERAAADDERRKAEQAAQTRAAEEARHKAEQAAEARTAEEERRKAEEAARARAAEEERRRVEAQQAREAMRLVRTSFRLPGDGVPNNNQSIGPFCCTGETLTVRRADGNAAGYVYFYSFEGGFNISSNRSGATSMEILVSGLANMANANSPQQQSSVRFLASEMKPGVTRSTRAGGFVFKVTVAQARLARGPSGVFYEMGSVVVRVDVSPIP